MPTNKQAIDWITRTLAFLAACCVVTVCILSYRALQIPPELNTLTAALVGSLASMLVKTSPTETTPTPHTPKPGDPPTPVTVANPVSDPANVAEVPKP